MKHTILVFCFGVLAIAQTTLPAVNTITAATEVCTVESQDANGGLFFQCQDSANTVVHTAVVEASASGAVFGHDSVACLYWQESAGKNRLQCSDGNKVSFDGYAASVTRKRRWYLFWK